MAKGRKTGGRCKGSRNKRTVAQLEAMAAAGEMLPLDHLLKIMRDENEDPDRRIWCAKAAAPYCHPKLASIEHTGLGAEPAEYTVVMTFDDPAVNRPGAHPAD
jgi:hypothetical protein